MELGSHRATRKEGIRDHTRLELFALANVAPTLLLALGLSWSVVMLTFCGGNALWMVLLLRHDAEVTRPHLLLATTIITIVGFTLAQLLEPANLFNGGMAWDGRHYASMYWQFVRGTYWPLVPESPYHQRVGLPFLAAQLPMDPGTAFFVLHVAFWLATMLLFALCCRTRFRVSAGWILLAVLWLQVLWFSIPRAVAMYRYHVDSALLFFLQAWVYVRLSDRRRWALLPIAFVGVFFKETLVLVVVVAAVADLILHFTRRRDAHFSVVLASVGLALTGKWLAAHVMPHPVIKHTELSTLYHWVIARSSQPENQVVRYVAAILATYGGFALLWCAMFGRPRVRSVEEVWALTVTGIYLAVCFFAGTDLSRFAYLGFPFILPVFLGELQQVRPTFGLLALIFGFPVAHALTMTPPSPDGMPHLDLTGGYSWMMEYAHMAVVGSWIGWWLAGVLLLRSIGFSSRWRDRFSAP